MIRFLARVGYVEGLSFLLLLGVAMPLKYQWGIDQAVSIVGMAHGALFLGYVLLLAVVTLATRLPIWALPAGIVAAVLPFGPFVFDRLLLTKTETINTDRSDS